MKPSDEPQYQRRALIPERWPDLESVFGPSGACWGCGRLCWRAPRGDFAGSQRKTMKARFRRRVKAGPPPGLIAYAGGEPVGWVQVGPRADVPNWNGRRWLSAPLEERDAGDPAVWAVSCFVVRREGRWKGVSRALLAAALGWARENGARCLDACPVEVAGEKKSPVSLYHGTAGMFRRAGFKEIARRCDGRPLLRLALAAGTQY